MALNMPPPAPHRPDEHHYVLKCMRDKMFQEDGAWVRHAPCCAREGRPHCAQTFCEAEKGRVYYTITFPEAPIETTHV